MSMELVEYNWNEITETAELVYEDQNGESHITNLAQPLLVTPNLDQYFGQLIVYLREQM